MNSNFLDFINILLKVYKDNIVIIVIIIRYALFLEFIGSFKVVFEFVGILVGEVRVVGIYCRNSYKCFGYCVLNVY